MKDSRRQLMEDISYGGIYGYAMARGIMQVVPSTLEFEDEVLRDVMNRATAVAYAESDGAPAAAIAKFRQIACDAYKLADSIFERCETFEPDTGEWETQLNELRETLNNLGIEVE